MLFKDGHPQMSQNNEIYLIKYLLAPEHQNESMQMNLKHRDQLERQKAHNSVYKVHMLHKGWRNINEIANPSYHQPPQKELAISRNQRINAICTPTRF